MSMAFQGSLLDTADEIELHTLSAGLMRTELSRGAWVDYRPGWLAGADRLFDELHDAVPWHAERREMYERIVDVPRLLKFYDEEEVLPHPVLTEAREDLSRHYAAELGEPFVTAGMCLYRDGRDSVAWHGDRVGRAKDLDTMVAILSIGSARTLALRPRGGGESRGFSLGHGDLVVMGGSCQRTWDHAIPKTTRAVGPRISIQFRPRGIR
jgi:alkylated DNA repair dioxygenase AlkB